MVRRSITVMIMHIILQLTRINMTVNLYQYDVNVRVAVIASSEEEATVLIEQGRAQHISGDRTLASVTEIVI